MDGSSVVELGCAKLVAVVKEDPDHRLRTSSAGVGGDGEYEGFCGDARPSRKYRSSCATKRSACATSMIMAEEFCSDWSCAGERSSPAPKTCAMVLIECWLPKSWSIRA